MRSTTTRPTLRISATVLLLALIAAACASANETTPDVASAATDLAAPTQPDEASATPADAGAGDELDTEDALLAYAECMRSEGVTDFPDPVFREDGSFSFPSPGSADQPTMVEAQATCRPFLDSVVHEFDVDPGRQAEIADQAVEFARCMRDNGIDLPDPAVGSGGDVSIGGGAFDPQSTQFQDALAVCQPLIFGGIGAGDNGGYSGGGEE